MEHEFDVVITDLIMCRDFGEMLQMDGREVALAAKRSNPKTKVIVLTAYSAMSSMAELLESGVDQVVSKAETHSSAIKHIVGDIVRSNHEKASTRGT